MTKKREAPIAPLVNPSASIIIVSTKVPITTDDGPIEIEDLAPATTQDGSTSVVQNKEVQIAAS